MTDTHETKVKEWKNTVHVNGKRKKGGIATFVSDKIVLAFQICMYYNF